MKKAILTGVILNLAYFTKTSALVLAFALFVYAFLRLILEKNKKYFKLTIVAIITFAIFTSPLIIRNLILLKFPFIEGLNEFFKFPSELAKLGWPKWLSDAFKTVSPVKPSLQTYTSTFGWIILITSIFGSSCLLSDWKKRSQENNFLLLIALPPIIFIIAFNLVYLTSYSPLETRYLSIIFPQLALLGGFFFWKMKEWNKLSLLVIIPILLFSIFTGITMAQSTHDSQRYPNDYLEALKWIKTNTPKDALLFTTYGSSVRYFGERNSIWAARMDEYFPKLMTTNNSTFISEILKSYNVSYIFMWRSTIAQNYIIPESNLWGVFTYNFANVISTDTEHFELVFSNQNNWVFKIK